ncbi:F-box/FBD/LRR-repeat protein At1g13570-like [Bidens hawaiensis]|uniref:F-box/FBD/LRR-repeat protein At1g13570-like n=1 Tax=Bidens hawaiensis TaxID=980011 RepID=UPI00404ACD47
MDLCLLLIIVFLVSIMELIQRTHKAFAPEDIISNMPDNVITSILERLPLQDAVRTDILSRSWRFKWTMVSQLVLDDDFFEYLSTKEGIYNHMRIFSRLLLHLKGAIRKCVLSMDVVDINDWILFFSRNGIQDLVLISRGNGFSPSPMLPTHLFSCLGLKHLKLYNCCLSPPPTFHGFPSLLSLELLGVRFESEQFGEFITRCPLLEILKVGDPGKVKLCHIAKLANLKILYLCLDDHENTAITCTIFEFLGSLPRLQDLHLDFQCGKDGTKKRFPTAFSCLETVKLSGINFGNLIMLSCVFEIIRHSPNLQTLEITASYPRAGQSPTICSSELDNNITGPLQLRSAVFIGLKGSENEVWLMKYLLESSPFLKKIAICLNRSLVCDEQVKFFMKLLKLQRAYPEVDFNLY